MNVVGMLITGTVNTLTMKILFTISSRDSTGHTALFEKPWFGTLNMLIAMLFVGVIDKAIRCMSSGPQITPDDDPAAEKLLGDDSPKITYNKKVMLVSAPAFFDLLATAFACIGIMYIPASVWQMLRGACIIFSAIFSITFLNRKMFGYNWLGLFIVIVGVCVVGGASVLSSGAAQGSSATAGHSDSNAAGDLVFGMLMVLLGQIFQASQVVAEEWLMKDVDLPAMQIIGWEGFWGALMMLVLVYPVLWLVPGHDHGHYEDAWDTWVMLTNSPSLVKCFLIYLTSCATFNATGIAVTGALSAVHRMMLDASRTTVIWAFGLVVHMYTPDALYAEVWTPYSPLQLIGFLILVAGQAVYGQVLRVPGLRYPEPSTAAAQWSSPSANKNLVVDLPVES